MSTIDISEWALKLVGMVAENKRMDVRMSLCLLIKIIFFMVWFYVSGDDKYAGGHYATTLFVWMIMHIYILVFERHYILTGENNIDLRKKAYKLTDMVQMAILITYFLVQVYSYNLQTTFNNLTLTSLFVDLSFNIDQYAKFIETRSDIETGKLVYDSTERREPNVKGGEGLLYFSIIAGSVLAIYLAVYMLKELLKNSELQTFPFFPATLYICIIGEIAFILYCLKLFFYCRVYFADNCSKNCLMIMYGISIGIFNLYYAFLLGSYCIVKLLQYLYELYQKCTSKNNQVHPTIY